MDNTYVIDTNALLLSEDVFQIIKENIIIPSVVLEELETFKNAKGELGYNARRSIRYIRNNKDNIKVDFINKQTELDYDKINDNFIIDSAKRNNAILVTDDVLMELRAENLGIQVLNIDNKVVDDNYKGYRILEINTNSDDDNEFLSHIYSSPEDNSLNLFLNEYLIIRDKANPVYDNDYNEKIGYKTLDILRWNGEKLVHLKTPPKRVVSPLNDLQMCALDLLINKDIPIKIIAGVYGSGKTLLSVLTGLHLVEDKGYYDKLVLVRNNDTNSGKDPGALPGTLDEKTDILFKTMIQHFPMGEVQSDKMRRDGKLETHITYFIKGLSINGYIIVDESEDLTRKDIKDVGSRLEKNGCMVFCGDWKQANGKFQYDNGLLHLLNSTKDNPLVGACVLDLDVRSDASKIFAEL